MARFQSRYHIDKSGFYQINVTPLVDVMLVLLIVFMATAPMMTTGVALDLPKTDAASLRDATEPLVISVNQAGVLFIQETEIASGELVEKLTNIARNNFDAEVYIRGDAQLNYGTVMEIMGRVNAAGFHKMTLVTEAGALAHKAQKKRKK